MFRSLRTPEVLLTTLLAAGILAMAVVPYVFSRAVQQARRNRAEA